MKKARTETIVAVVVFFVIMWMMMTTGITAVWLTEEVRSFGRAMLPAAIVAAVLVLYVDWRARLLRRIRGGRNTERRRQRKAA